MLQFFFSFVCFSKKVLNSFVLCISCIQHRIEFCFVSQSENLWLLMSDYMYLYLLLWPKCLVLILTYGPFYSFPFSFLIFILQFWKGGVSFLMSIFIQITLKILSLLIFRMWLLVPWEYLSVISYLSEAHPLIERMLCLDQSQVLRTKT